METTAARAEIAGKASHAEQIAEVQRRTLLPISRPRGRDDRDGAALEVTVVARRDAFERYVVEGEHKVPEFSEGGGAVIRMDRVHLFEGAKP